VTPKGEPISVEFLFDSPSLQPGRSLAAWIGLVPRQHSTGGKERLGRISKQGNRQLRWLLVAGAMAVIRYARQHGTKRPPHPARLPAMACAFPAYAN
jgi:transposase